MVNKSSKNQNTNSNGNTVLSANKGVGAVTALTQQAHGAKPNIPQDRQSGTNIDNIEVALRILIGQASMPLSQFLQLNRGGVILLDGEKAQNFGKNDDDLDLRVLANGRDLAAGQVRLDGETIHLEITHCLSGNEHTSR